MKLPITPILYLASLGLFAGAGWMFWQTLQVGQKIKPMGEIDEEVKLRLKEGGDLEPAGVRDLYGGQHTAWWEGFRSVNLIGTLPPEPEAEKPVEEVKPPAPPVKPLDQIFDIVAVLAASKDAESMLVIRYRPDANVQIPEVDGMGATVRGDVLPVPAARPVPGRGSSMPQAAPQDPAARLLHQLRLEDTLWKPYDNIRLVRVSTDASSAFFLREDPAKEKSEWKEEEVLKKSLDLPDDIYRILLAGGLARETTRRPESQDPLQANPATGSAWQDVAQTKEMRPGEFHIGQEDDAYLKENMQRVLEDLPLREYRSQSGGVSGIQIAGRINIPEVQRLGFQEGDVLISINGTPTTTRAQGIKVGREQYDRGVTEFRIKFYRAGQLQERTYIHPDRKK